VRVLVVEDERRLAAALKRGLAADGFVVEVAHDGTDGLWMAQEQQYDAVVLDIMLPGINGFKLCATLRAQGIWTPILMLTAKDGEYDEVEALDTGADDFLSKPFSYLVLVARLRALLRRGARERPPVLTVGDLRVDPAARTCHRGDTAIALTGREFALLECLARRAGQTISKAELLADVWDAGFDGDANVVEVYIGYLRRKIDVPFGVASIHTVRGAGYRLAADDG
jgi:two-component system OmpR family response regulator